MQNDKKDYFLINELAKLRNVTTETLRHYDRIGLFKPDYIDEETKYRYYSPEQYEKLGTIIELRQLGLSLAEIKDYFTARNVKKSIEILEKYNKKLKEDIKKQVELEKVISKKIKFVYSVYNGEIKEMEPEIKKLPARYILKGRIDSEVDYCIEFMNLEKMLPETAPMLASNRAGLVYECLEDMENDLFSPFVFCTKNEKRFPNFIKLAEEEFLCIFVHDYTYTQNNKRVIELAKRYAEEQGFELTGRCYAIYQIDITLTDSPNETLIEMQFELCKKAAM